MKKRFEIFSFFRKYRLLIFLVSGICFITALYFAIRVWGWATPLGLLATFGVGVGAVTGMTPIKRDPGRAARPDMGGRGTTPVETKDAEGKTVVVEKRTRPRRPGGGRF